MPPKRKSAAVPASGKSRGKSKKEEKKISSSRVHSATNSVNTADRTVTTAAASANSARMHEALQMQLTQHGYQLSQTGVAYVSVSQVASEHITQCSQDPLGEHFQDTQQLTQDSSSDESLDECSNEKSLIKLHQSPATVGSADAIGKGEDQYEDNEAFIEESKMDERAIGNKTDDQRLDQRADDPRDEQDIGDDSSEEGSVQAVKSVVNCEKCTFFKRELERRNAEIRRLRKLNADLNRDRVARDDHTLSLSRELQELKENRKIPSVSFTNDNAIDITLEELKAIDGQSSSDSMFVANLAIHFFGTDRLRNMSITGKPTPRFKRLLKEDGSLVYPAREKMDPKIYKFICEKLSERVAMRLGPSKVKQITYYADEKNVRKALAVKISNLNKAAVKRASRNPRV